MGIRLSDDKELVEEIDKKLKKNKEKYGKAFCPCILPSMYTADSSDDDACMCKEFREQNSGECHCGKFIKE